MNGEKDQPKRKGPNEILAKLKTHLEEIVNNGGENRPSGGFRYSENTRRAAAKSLAELKQSETKQMENGNKDEKDRECLVKTLSYNQSGATKSQRSSDTGNPSTKTKKSNKSRAKSTAGN